MLLKLYHIVSEGPRILGKKCLFPSSVSEIKEMYVYDKTLVNMLC